MKALADDKSIVTQNIKVVFHWIENIVGKEENAGNQHFLLFPQCFLSYETKRFFPPACQKSSLCGNGLTLSQTTNLRLFLTERVCRQQFQT